MNNPHETADVIKAAAKSRKVSISKLLADCELNKNALYTMQSSGYFPRVEALAKIADYLDCSVDYLLGRTDNPEVNQSPIGDGNNRAPEGDGNSTDNPDVNRTPQGTETKGT